MGHCTVKAIFYMYAWGKKTIYSLSYQNIDILEINIFTQKRVFCTTSSSLQVVSPIGHHIFPK